MNLDDCWQSATRDENGNIQPDPVRFPSGLKALGDYIHSKGLKFGIYSSAGFKTCQGFPASLGVEEVDAAKPSRAGRYCCIAQCAQCAAGVSTIPALETYITKTANEAYRTKTPTITAKQTYRLFSST